MSVVEAVLKKAGATGPMARGTWRMFGAARVMVCCPTCGGRTILGQAVNDKGLVNPSVVCPRNCGWHAMVTLEGWRP